MPRGKPLPKLARKHTKVQLRLRPEQKALIAEAAHLRQTTLSKFMLEHAVTAAQQVLADQVHFRLPPEQWRAFCAALDAPPRVLPALQALFAEPSIFEDQGRVAP